MVFPGGSVVKNLPANAGDAGSVPGLGRSPGRGNGNPLQYSCLKKSCGRGAWRATVHGITESTDWVRAHTHLLNGSIEMPLFWSFFRMVTTEGSLVAWKGWQTGRGTRQGFLRKMLSRKRVTLVGGEGKAATGSVRPWPGWELAAHLCSQVHNYLPLLSTGSKGTNKEGGGPANSRGGSTPPALGDLFAGGFPVLRPAGQRDAAGKEGFKLAIFDSYLLALRNQQGSPHLPISDMFRVNSDVVGDHLFGSISTRSFQNTELFLRDLWNPHPV